MPLIKGGGRAAMSQNIKTEMAAGKPQRQAIAIAYSEAGEKGYRHGQGHKLAGRSHSADSRRGMK
jgi:hypothetical protein